MRRFVSIALLSAGCESIFPLNAPDFTPGVTVNIAFVTSSVHDGNLGGLDGADAICQQAAESADLAGTYRAWLSTADTPAIDRLSGARGWVRPDGAPVADRPADLTARGPLVPLSVTEVGDDIRPGGLEVWTGTELDGTKAFSNCDDWVTGTNVQSGQFGQGSLGGIYFTSSNSTGCDKTHRLYCFGTELDVELVVTPSSDPIVFVSDQKFIPTSTIAGADDICAAEARDAMLSGRFVAALAPTGQTVAELFGSASYARVDGVRVGRFLSASVLDTFPVLTANNTLTDLDGVWTGGLPTDLNMDVGNCVGWTTGAGASGHVGDQHNSIAGGIFRASDANDCTVGKHVYCLQQ